MRSTLGTHPSDDLTEVARLPAWIGLLGLLASCAAVRQPESPLAAKVDDYAVVRLEADLSTLSPGERRMLPLLIEAADHMDAIFWVEANPIGTRESLLDQAPDDATRRFLEINYGPWDRLADLEPFLPGIGPKPPGSSFYPIDMTAEEAERAAQADPEFARVLNDPYTVVVREPDGSLAGVPYRRLFAHHVQPAADLLERAAGMAEDPGLRRYLSLRAEALRTDEYGASDRAWLDMKDNGLDIVIGPIETYEDRLLGVKAAHEAYVLVKDKAWSARLSRYAAFLPELQAGLPVPEAYRRETPGTDSDLNAYDVVYYAGDCNAGSKTIAINLPNDEQVQLEKGTRRLQLKNAMRAKFDEILLPLSDVLIDREQRRHITFDAFFANTMFHEVAHGLGIKNTLDGSRTVREALRELGGALEEGKADILGLYMVTELFQRGELEGGELMDHYVTFLASIFRSVRFGASSAHGKANMIRFNVFERMGAFTRDEATGTYRVDFERMQEAMTSLTRTILTLQGDGDYDGTAALFAQAGFVGPALQRDLDRLEAAGIPVDVVFEQGPAVLGLR